MTAAGGLPRVAMVLGDPAGIGPELVARLLADPATRAEADVLLIADRGLLADGQRVAGQSFALADVASADGPFSFTPGVPLLLEADAGGPSAFERAVVSADGGAYCLRTLHTAITLAQRGLVDAVCFAPLNKAALHAAGMAHADELHWFAEQLGHAGTVCEFNVLDGLWTSRVTSHVALAEVPKLISADGVVAAIRLIDTALRRSGMAEPRIAVCGLNPHNGDNGSFGREEIDVIGPAVEAARAAGMAADGPFPADTIFLRVQGGPGARAYDAVVTMYHDQGQIAMKLMGFQRGVTVQGGLPLPITTPAHGTAFDIAGRGRADVGAMREAFLLATRMARASA